MWSLSRKSAFREGATASNRDYAPSQAAIKAAFAAVSSFYDFLTQESIIGTNPVSLIRQKSKFVRKDQNQAVVRRLSNLKWNYVLETAERLAQEDPDVHDRTLFIMTVLFALNLRISELVADERSAPIIGDFRKDPDGNWWYHVTGKGNKDRTVTSPNAMLQAFKRYRRSVGLSSLPVPNESGPLVVKHRGQGPRRELTSDSTDRTELLRCCLRANVR